MTPAQQRAATMQPLRAYMRRTGRRYDWLAEQLGLRPNDLTQILMGRFLTPPTFFADAAEALSIELDEIDGRLAVFAQAS